MGDAQRRLARLLHVAVVKRAAIATEGVNSAAVIVKASDSRHQLPNTAGVERFSTRFGDCLVQIPDGSNEFVNRRWRAIRVGIRKTRRAAGMAAAVHPDDLPKLTECGRDHGVGQGGELRGVFVAAMANAEDCRVMVVVVGFVFAPVSGWLVTYRLLARPTRARDRKLKAEIDELRGQLPSQSHAMMDVDYHFSNLWFAGRARTGRWRSSISTRGARTAVGRAHHSRPPHPGRRDRPARPPGGGGQYGIGGIGKR